MDLSKKIKLYYGKSPVSGGSDKEMQKRLDKETSFCAVFVRTDLPDDVHNKTMDALVANYGANSSFAVSAHTYVRPFLVDSKDVACVGVFDPNADKLRGSGFRVGGFFFHENIAAIVTAQLEKMGYEIRKMY